LNVSLGYITNPVCGGNAVLAAPGPSEIDVALRGHSIPHPKELIPFSCLRMISILKSYVVFSYLNQAPGETLQQNLQTSRRTSKENQNANESYPNMSTLFHLIDHADSCQCLGAGLYWLF